MDEAEVTSLLRCCQDLRQFELQPILGMTPGVPWHHAKPVAQGINTGLYHCRQNLEVLTIDAWTTSTPAQPVDLTEYRHLTKLTLPTTEAVKLEDRCEPLARMVLLPTLDVIWERSHTSKVPEMRKFEGACACRGIIFSSRLSHR